MSQNDSPIAARANRPGARRGHGHGRRMGPVEKPKDFKGTMKKMLVFLGGYKWLLALVFVFAICSTGFNVIAPKVLSTATTVLFEGASAKLAGTGGIDFDAIFRILLITFVIYIVSSLCAFVQGVTMAEITQRASFKLRQDITEKINRMPLGYFERTSTGDVLSRITNDVDTLGHSMNQSLTQAVTSTITVVGVFIMMLSINWIMTLIAVCIIPMSAFVTLQVVKRSQKYFVRQQDLLGAINGQVEETFSGHAVVRAFGQEEAVTREFIETSDKLYEAAWKSQFLSGLMAPLMRLVGNAGYVVIAIVGAFFAAAGAITVGDIQAFVQYVNNFTRPISQLAQVANSIQQMFAAAERIFNFLDEPEEIAEEETAGADDCQGDVEFEHVVFGYDPEKPVIRDFSAHVKAGQTVALVGPTGAGKTTMVKLLMRFYDVQGGAIKIGGHDVRDYSRETLRESFGMVLQDTWLFHGSIRDNIRYGRLDATDEEVIEAAKAGCAHHFIETLPGGYDFVINEDATNISQGQRQLLTIARAILADRKMLILDEATSSVDTRTEERIQRAMDNLMHGRTSFVIAHRLSTIRNADLILVIRDGDIVEQGSHDELLSVGGFYADLYNSQFVECNDRFED